MHIVPLPLLAVDRTIMPHIQNNMGHLLLLCYMFCYMLQGLQPGKRCKWTGTQQQGLWLSGASTAYSSSSMGIGVLSLGRVAAAVVAAKLHKPCECSAGGSNNSSGASDAHGTIARGGCSMFYLLAAADLVWGLCDDPSQSVV